MDLNPNWRSELSHEALLSMVNRIMDTLTRHMPAPVSVPIDLSEINKIAVRFEQKIYNVAFSQPDYLRKIALKMLSVETKTPSQVKPKECKLCGNCSHKRRNAC